MKSGGGDSGFEEWGFSKKLLFYKSGRDWVRVVEYRGWLLGSLRVLLRLFIMN